MTERAPQLAELLSAVLEHRLSQVHVCMPGIVESYDATKQTASVRPAIKNVIVTGAFSGEQELEFPVIPDVPVCHPRAGAWFVHLPLSAGDTVMLHFAERSLDQWRALGGVQNPLDLRKHDLSDAIAVPVNLYPDASPLVGVSADHLSLGKDGGSSIHINADGTIAIGSGTPLDSAATALKVNTELTALKALISGIGPDLIALYTLLGIPSPWGTIQLPAYLATGAPHDVASTKVKVDP